MKVLTFDVVISKTCLNIDFLHIIDVVLLDPGPHRHDRTARGFCVFRACRISKVA